MKKVAQDGQNDKEIFGKEKSMQRSTRLERLNRSKYSRILLCAGAFCLTVTMMFCIYYGKAFSPFGDRSLATMDANIQYLDFFSYLKDVLSGNNSISYTFSKGLGGSGIAVFAYYLASPFNLLVVFFPKSRLTVFFDLVVALKIGTAAFTAACFLQERFQRKLNACLVLLLSVSYAMMQYSIAQSSNIMWLDGVYMLPLMLLGVYRIVNGGRSYFLIFSTGLTILFNWYVGCINCLYSAVWLCLEWLLAVSAVKATPGEIAKGAVKTIGRYAGCMVLGIMLSACLFLPAVFSLFSGGRGGIEWSLFKNTFTGDILNVIQNLTIKSTSSNGSVSLYCGSLPILGCLCFFISRRRRLRKKLIVGAILLLSLLIFYWQPLVAIFSLLKSVGSYWYRYSYVTIFLLIFIAADYYSELEQEEHAARDLFISALLFSNALLALSLIDSVWETKNVIYTCGFAIAISVLAAFYAKQFSARKKTAQLVALVLACAVIVELGDNAQLLMQIYSLQNENAYGEYSIEQQTQIEQLQELDTGTYRISQTSTYNIKSNNLTANYNEAMAYGYWPSASYTSDPDYLQLTLLAALGYPRSGSNMCVVDTSIVAADSLLGVKYVLSSYEINGLEKVETIETANGKDVYYNPFALPLALVYDADAYSADTEQTLNPFEYQNLLYSQLMGEKTELYTAVAFESSDDDANLTYTLELPEGNYAAYGNLMWSTYLDATLSVNNSYECGYAMWLSPSVFYIPTESGDSSASVILNYENWENPNNYDSAIKDEQFYILNLDKLTEVSETLTAQAADIISIQNGTAQFEVTASEGDDLLLSIPYDSGWTITLNGEKIEAELFADCLYSIPLQEGTNTIKMSYHVPYLTVGVVVTGVAIILVMLMFILRRRQK
ncbi:MAG: YfhO family protein [Clostridiales bacterium]|nr:YfhO family protein [Clostridiales bacterium]